MASDPLRCRPGQINTTLNTDHFCTLKGEMGCIYILKYARLPPELLQKGINFWKSIDKILGRLLSHCCCALLVGVVEVAGSRHYRWHWGKHGGQDKRE